MTEAAETAKQSNDPVLALVRERDALKESLALLRQNVDTVAGSSEEGGNRISKLHALRGERDTWKSRAEFEEDAKKELATERNALTLERDAVCKELVALKDRCAAAESELRTAGHEVDRLIKERNDLATVLDSRPFRPEEPDTADALDISPEQVRLIATESATLRNLLIDRYGQDAFDDNEADPSLGDLVSDEAVDMAAAYEEGHAESEADTLKRMNLPPRTIKPETVLEEAARIVDGPRRTHYGHPAENHGRTALFWNGYLGIDPFGPDAIDGHDVCQMNNLQKISRESGKGRKPRRQRDTLVDLCGYTRNAEIIDSRPEGAVQDQDEKEDA